MTIRQRILKAVYPLIMMTSGLTGRKKIIANPDNIPPVQSIYNLKFTLLSGEEKSLAEYRGRKILLVNTASECGYTDQLESLQKLWEHNKDSLVIIAFPSNDFKNQEKLNNSEIASFCSNIYHITFPVAQKTVVKKSEEQHPIYQWLSDKKKNGWYEKPPIWNFSKYLVDENGILTHYFDPGVDPVSAKVIRAII
jgi:glutathione peroxidase